MIVGASPAPAAEQVPSGPTRAKAWIARVVVPTAARAQPGSGRIVMRIATQAKWNGGPVSLLVLGSRSDGQGRLWIEVGLPARPNGASGWIRADLVQLRPTAYRVEISTGRRVVRLLHHGRLLRSFGAVVGQPAYPTPHGLFAVSERVAQPDPDGFLGPWALHLTAFSPTLIDFGGGPGTVAIHGRAGASLRDPLGTARSHGCIRIPNEAIRLLASVAREGTPVLITG